MTYTIEYSKEADRTLRKFKKNTPPSKFGLKLTERALRRTTI